MLPKSAAVALLALSLAACQGKSDVGGNDRLESASRSLQPAEAALAEIYNRSCRSCHTVAATGAPLTGDADAWAERYEKGMGTLVDNVINGYGGMPALGLCMECDADQFEALIDFMATPPEARP